MTTLKYFGTSITVAIYDAGSAQAESVLCDSVNTIERLHKLGSDYDTYDNIVNIKAINNAPTEVHKIEPELAEIIAAGIEWHQLSDGYFNIAIGPVVQVWRRYRNQCTALKMANDDCLIPTDKELIDAIKYSDISNIKLNKTVGTVSMAEGMSLDLGGIAKGWMAEQVYQQLVDAGVASFVINAGGNIRHFGQHPEKRLFTTAIEDPICKKANFEPAKCNQFDNQFHEIVAAEDIAVVSSGNYLKYFTVDNVDYHHIINPKTLFPKTTGISTTVVLNDNHIYADVLSTTLFLMPLDKAIKMAEDLQYVEAVWYLDKHGNKKTTAKFDKYRLNYNSTDFVSK
ncbi:FAD:protein FMN transferase [Ferrimonas lipolytica]|uniref:FAD:protein FMN transferase n=1 Tax=Ferrimonas lipolytica TaxID=2724191 RepID=A0A6H1UGQ3_9GAMM|nr:FAD:protein FMN transferase [Ferrimonas lipolytica]QIZ76972.1 FAD:protein FMN transferase [Ferrimonas lipolytica]